MSYNIKTDKNPMSVNIRKLQRYNFKFLSLPEVIFYEYMIIKAKAFNYKEFFHSTSTITNETGLKRNTLDTIIKKFISLEMISIIVKGCPKTKYFHVNFVGIESLLPKIYRSEALNNQYDDFHKVVDDFYKPFVESYKQKNINKETIKETIGDVVVVVVENKLKKINEEIQKAKSQYSLYPSMIKFDELQFTNLFRVYGNDTLIYLQEFFFRYRGRSNLANFFKASKDDPNRNNFIEEILNNNISSGEILIRRLIHIFQERSGKV